MLKRISLALAVLSCAGAAIAVDASEKQAAGVWQTASGGYVQMYQDNGKWAAKIVGSSSGKARYDNKNPDESKRGRRLLGVNVLQGLEYQGDGEFEDGEIYDPNNGKTYKAKAHIESPDKLSVRGYIGISLIGKSQTWTRVDPQARNVHQDLLHKPVGGGS